MVLSFSSDRFSSSPAHCVRRYGVCTESVPSAVAAIDRVGAAEWEELAERFVFVLLGATSEMGALQECAQCVCVCVCACVCVCVCVV